MVLVSEGKKICMEVAIVKKSEKIVKELSDEELMDITGGATYSTVTVTINPGTFRLYYGIRMYYGVYYTK